MCFLQLEKAVEDALAKEREDWEKERDKFMSKIKKLQKKGRKKGKKGEEDDEDDAGAGAVAAGVSAEELEKVLNQLMDKKLKTIKKIVMKVQSSCYKSIRPTLYTFGLVYIYSACCRGKWLLRRMTSLSKRPRLNAQNATRRSRQMRGSSVISTNTISLSPSGGVYTV